MKDIYTIGFTQKTAKKFFELLKKNKINLLIDIRLKPTSQLAAYSKKEDLKYFLKEILNANYLHLVELAPSETTFEQYRKDKNWDKLETKYLEEIKSKDILKILDKNLIYNNNAVFLCSEHQPEKCHRRLLVEYLSELLKDISIIHLI